MNELKRKIIGPDSRLEEFVDGDPVEVIGLISPKQRSKGLIAAKLPNSLIIMRRIANGYIADEEYHFLQEIKVTRTYTYTPKSKQEWKRRSYEGWNKKLSEVGL